MESFLAVGVWYNSSKILNYVGFTFLKESNLKVMTVFHKIFVFQDLSKDFCFASNQAFMIS